MSLEDLGLPGINVSIQRGFLDRKTSARLFTELMEQVKWRQDTIRMFGHTHNVPRKHQWFSRMGQTYTWSGIRMEPQAMVGPVEEVWTAIDKGIGMIFDGVLANLYRDGRDTVGWHTDDEEELGEVPVIASLSLGVTRDFQLRHKDHGRHTYPLHSGDLVLMAGSQGAWQHQLPRRTRVNEPRINLTFRTMVG